MDCVRIKLKKDKDLKAKPIESMADAAQFIQSLISDFDRELFVSVNVDVRNKPLNYSIISMGSLDASVVHPREVFKTAILSSANSIFCFHNHPSGNVEPSVQDIIITNRLIAAGEILGIRVMDHIIVAEDNFFSFAKEGMMDQEINMEHISELNTFCIKKMKELISLSKQVHVPITIKYNEQQIGLHLDESTSSIQWLSLEEAIGQLKKLRLIQRNSQVMG